MELFKPVKKIIPTPRYYNNDEIFATIKEQSGFPYEPEYGNDIWRGGSGKHSKKSQVVKLPATKGFEIFIRTDINILTKQYKITVARVEKYYYSHILGILFGIISGFLLVDVGVNVTNGIPVLGFVGMLAGGYAGFWLGYIISGLTGKNHGEKWGAYLGKDDYTIRDIVEAVSDRLQQLFT